VSRIDHHRQDRDRGSVVVLMAVVLCFAGLAAVGVARLGAAVAARAAADTAADAAALAAADSLALGDGPDAALAAARLVAAANDASVLTCRCAGLDAVVEVERAGVRARAHAEVRPGCTVPALSGPGCSG